MSTGSWLTVLAPTAVAGTVGTGLAVAVNLATGGGPWCVAGGGRADRGRRRGLSLAVSPAVGHSRQPTSRTIRGAAAHARGRARYR